MPEDKTSLNADIIATLRDVTVTYDGYLTRALTHVNLDVRRGEVLGVLGAKGAGKSTALKILAGRLRPTEGTVKVFGRSPRGGATKARVGYLPGKVDSGRPPGFFGRLFGKKNESSSPERNIGRLPQAILGNRDLLILDDPFDGLEPAELSEAKALVKDLVARGKTVILSSDSLMEVKDICQRIVIFDEGKIQATGTLVELLAGGGAVRFFPAILPNDIVERVLKMLREEILGESVSRQTAASSLRTNLSSASSGIPQAEATAVHHSDRLLTSLTKTGEGVPQMSVDSKTTDPIDHEKLEGLTKSDKPK